MSDILREIEEDVRRERLQKFWKAYGDYVIAAVVLAFAAVGGWQLWQKHEADERAKAAGALVAAQNIANPTQAADAFNTLAKDAPGGYALVARLSEANAMVASGQGKNGIDLYKEIAAQDSGVIGTIARLRAAWALAESAPRKELEDLLAPLDKDGSAWQPLAREVLAYADYRSLDLKAAEAKYRALAADMLAPAPLRRRAEAMAAYLKNGGAANYGTVPQPPAAAPAPPPAPPAK